MKSSYVVILIISVGVFLFSAKKVYEKLNNYLYCSNIASVSNQNIKSQHINELTASFKEETKNNETQSASLSQSTTSTSTYQETELSQQQTKNYKYTIRYENKKAKNVKLTGSFWAWKERDMKKISPGVWEEELVLKDRGVYKYYFTVDGKRVLDPKAKQSQDGKFSLFEIK